jgi:hypothetical protein
MNTLPSRDAEVRAALATLSSGARPTFDAATYGRAFHASAQAKAGSVVEELRHSRFKDLQPVFVSIGGADGEELACLLQCTNASTGILLEGSRDLAESARRRTLPPGKTIEVFEGDATDNLPKALQRAAELVNGNHAQYQAVTCHAVIHELYDRGKNFNPLLFFGSIFRDHQIPTWFTYREPGAPEKWPDQILLRAHCASATLKDLADELVRRHVAFRDLQPPPSILGDHILLNRTLAMELIVKLFYLEDLWYEMQERSTSVDHQAMMSALLLAIGDDASQQGRGTVSSESAATISFERLWSEWGLRVAGMVGVTRRELSIPESQTRVVAWRTPPQPTTAPQASSQAEPEALMSLNMAFAANTGGDTDLLQSLVISKGRSWIELDLRDRALQLLETIKSSHPVGSLLGLWSHYLVSISSLFSGQADPSAFSDVQIAAAESHGLALLFLAESVEFRRKAGDFDGAVVAARKLTARLPASNPNNESTLQRYAVGTAFFIFGNLLRAGGLYSLALQHLDRAETWLLPTIASHNTERLHCFYARAISHAVQGRFASPPQAPFVQLSDVDEQFASALIALAYSSAAWFIDDLTLAVQYAENAAATFDKISAAKYAKRARSAASLIRAWQALDKGLEPDLAHLDRNFAKAVLFLSGRSDDTDWFIHWFQQSRPSVAVGLLQFRRFARAPLPFPPSIALPALLNASDTVGLEWQTLTAAGIDQVDHTLRRHMDAAQSGRIALLSD